VILAELEESRVESDLKYTLNSLFENLLIGSHSLSRLIILSDSS
jgi:hypothetical protein